MMGLERERIIRIVEHVSELRWNAEVARTFEQVVLYDCLRCYINPLLTDTEGSTLKVV